MKKVLTIGCRIAGYKFIEVGHYTPRYLDIAVFEKICNKFELNIVNVSPFYIDERSCCKYYKVTIEYKWHEYFKIKRKLEKIFTSEVVAKYYKNFEN